MNEKESRKKAHLSVLEDLLFCILAFHSDTFITQDNMLSACMHSSLSLQPHSYSQILKLFMMSNKSLRSSNRDKLLKVFYMRP